MAGRAVAVMPRSPSQRPATARTRSRQARHSSGEPPSRTTSYMRKERSRPGSAVASLRKQWPSTLTPAGASSVRPSKSGYT
ncbi:hypothetical protein [Actinomadura madurae]|uniref:hypothetical protein n=1 Tax=Actinomadura madurae TaxID=1993 RepID=UPI0020D1F777|nr:hypothetical protein [Actinomadura madurae]MCP9967910.1 hypothetical protein [Actinomadura madurae]MCQ0008116.1 hypothetical protein [Actinomadura madurae]